MRNVVFTIRFHPNEEVAAEMAKLVAKRLKQEDCNVTIVDLETLRNGWRKTPWAKEYAQDDMARASLLLKARKKYPGETFDWHDSSLEGLKQRYNTEEPILELVARGGYYLVEVPAVYAPQENPAISIHGEGEKDLITRYFLERSNVGLSHEVGLLSPEKVENLAKQISEIVKQGDK